MELRDIIDAVDEAPKEDAPLIPKRNDKEIEQDMRRIQPIVSVLTFARVVFLAAAMLFSGVLVIAMYLYLTKPSS